MKIWTLDLKIHYLNSTPICFQLPMCNDIQNILCFYYFQCLSLSGVQDVILYLTTNSAKVKQNAPPPPPPTEQRSSHILFMSISSTHPGFPIFISALLPYHYFLSSLLPPLAQEDVETSLFKYSHLGKNFKY